MASVSGESCPDELQLTAFLEGRLSDAKLDEVYSHVEQCAACTSLVEQLEAENPSGPLPFPSCSLPLAADDSDHAEVINRALALHDQYASWLEDRASSSAGPGDGEQLGDYRIIREIGRGGMGIVYEAEQSSLGRPVALKVLPDHVSEVQSRRFANEAKAVARLHHTNIVPVFDVGVDAGRHFYAMQFIDGLSLREVSKELQTHTRAGSPDAGARQAHHEAGPEESLANQQLTSANELSAIAHDLLAFDDDSSDSGSRSSQDLSSSRTDIARYWKSVARIGMQVASALQYAHDQHVTHRDIKPANLLIDRDLNVWVTDFGLAKVGEDNDLTRTGDILGTIRYMAPETFATGASAGSDIYSLGLTLYELVTLEAAFACEDKRQLIQQVTSEAPLPIRRRRADVPEDLATIIHKAIEREPRDRYRSAAALHEDLRRFLNDEPIRAKRTSAAQHLRRWARRNRALAVSVLGIFSLLAFIVVGSVFVAWRMGESAEQITQAQQTTTRNLYFASMRNAYDALNQHRGLQKAKVILQEWVPRDRSTDLRDWEWYYLNSLCHQEDESIQAAVESAYALAVRPDGKLFASGGEDSIVRIWNGSDHRCIGELPQPFDSVYSLDWHPLGHLVAVAGRDGVTLWNVDSGQCIFHVLRGKSVLGVKFSPSGELLAASTEFVGNQLDNHFLVDVQTGETVFQQRMRSGEARHYTLQLDWSRDGNLVAFPHGTSIALFGSGGVQIREELEFAGWSQHCVAFHPANQHLIAAGGRDAIVKIFDRRSHDQPRQLAGHTHGVSALAWHPDGQRLASASWDGTIRVWDTLTGRTLVRLQGHAKHVFALHWINAGRQLISSGDDGLIKFWSPDTARFELHQGSPRRIVSMELSPDGSMFCFGNLAGQLVVLDAETFEVQSQWQLKHDNAYLAGFHPSKPLVAAVDELGTVQIHHPQTGALMRSSTARYPGGLSTADWSRGGGELAFSGRSGYIEFRDPSLGETRPAIEVGHTVQFLAWSPVEAKLAYTAGAAIKVVDLKREISRTIRLPEDARRLAWSHDGTRLVVAMNNDARIVHLDSQADVALPGHFETILGLAWAPGDRRLVSVDARGTVKIWDTDTGHETLSMHEQYGRFNCAVWSPDGRRIIVDCDNHLLVWDASVGYDHPRKQ